MEGSLNDRCEKGASAEASGPIPSPIAIAGAMRSFSGGNVIPETDAPATDPPATESPELITTGETDGSPCGSSGITSENRRLQNGHLGENRPARTPFSSMLLLQWGQAMPMISPE